MLLERFSCSCLPTASRRPLGAVGRTGAPIRARPTLYCPRPTLDCRSVPDGAGRRCWKRQSGGCGRAPPDADPPAHLLPGRPACAAGGPGRSHCRERPRGGGGGRVCSASPAQLQRRGSLSATRGLENLHPPTGTGRNAPFSRRCSDRRWRQPMSTFVHVSGGGSSGGGAVQRSMRPVTGRRERRGAVGERGGAVKRRECT